MRCRTRPTTRSSASPPPPRPGGAARLGAMPTLLRERLDDGLEVLRLDRPERRNAMDSRLILELIDALEELAGDEELDVLVVSTTSERALCAGADVTETLDDAGAVRRMELFARLYSALDAVTAPT